MAINTVMRKKDPKFVIVDQTASPLKYLASGIANVRLSLMFTTDPKSARIFRTNELAEIYLKDLLWVKPDLRGRLKVYRLDKVDTIVYDSWNRAMQGV